MNDVTLREYLETQINWVDRHFASQILTIQEKTREAKGEIDKRLESMNEFRLALKDTTAQQATKPELAALEKQIDLRLKALEMNRANLEGKAAVVAVVVASVVSILVVAVSNWITR